MSIIVTDIFISDIGFNNGCGLDFKVNGDSFMEYIDVEDNFKVCTSSESCLILNYNDDFTGYEIAEIHDQLIGWLADNPMSEEDKIAILAAKNATRAEYAS